MLRLKQTVAYNCKQGHQLNHCKGLAERCQVFVSCSHINAAKLQLFLLPLEMLASVARSAWFPHAVLSSHHLHSLVKQRGWHEQFD